MEACRKRIFDTTSSVYPLDFAEITGPPSPQTPESQEIYEDVYRPFITPPSPFEKTTQQGKKSTFNPYAQSLWFTSRGNKGEEITKYMETTTACSKDEIHRDDNISKPLLKDFEELLPRPPLGNLGESNKENLSKLCIDADPDTVQRASKLISKRLGVVLDTVSGEPPHKLILMETRLAKIFKILHHLSIKFEVFVEENGILCHPLLFPHLFGHVKTLCIIHCTFQQKLLDDVYPIQDLEDVLYDHLQRLSHVYPSYFQTISVRTFFVREIEKDHLRFAHFLRLVHKYLEEYDLHNGISTFGELIIAPAEEIRQSLAYIHDFIGDKSPRLKAVAEKLGTAIENHHEQTQHVLEEPIYLDIPSCWSTKYKSNKEERLENKILQSFRHDFKLQYSEYLTSVEMMRTQISHIANLSTTNIRIAKGFLAATANFKRHGTPVTQEAPTPRTKLFQENMIKSIHSMYVDKIDIQNKVVYQLLYNFDQTFSVRATEVNDLCLFVLNTSKALLKDSTLDRHYKTEQLYHYFQFQKLLKSVTLVLYEKYRTFMYKYIDTICSTNSYDPTMTVEKLVNCFKMAHESQLKALTLSGAEFTEKTIKDKFAQRFFNNYV